LECTDRPFISNLSTETKNRIEYILKVPTTKTDFTSAADIAQRPNAKIAYNLMRIGVEGRQEFTIAVKRTLIVSRLYTPIWSLVNNGYVISRSFLIGNYNVDSSTAVFLPNSTGIQTDANGVDYMYGYLEQKPTRQTLANNKVQLEQNWIYNKWSAGPRGLYDTIF
jgi:hypothetical protein